MQEIQGVAKNVRTSVEHSGGHNDSSISTTHICVFQIENQAVTISSGSPCIINDGDQVRVVGNLDKGVFKGLAYKNLTLNLQDNDSWVGLYAGGGFFIVIGLFVAITSAATNTTAAIIGIIIGIGSVAAGSMSIARGARIQQAASKIEQPPS